MTDESTPLLDDAATQLLAAGCSEPEQVEAALRLRCLWAVEELRGIGARAQRDLASHDVEDPSSLIDAAIAALKQVAAAADADAPVAATVREVVEKLRGTRW